jgi:site-specific DNA-methyltransferase (adenine-specific)
MTDNIFDFSKVQFHKEILADGVTLYLGDCIDVLSELNNVDHAITDPPYDAEAHTQQRRAKRGHAMKNESLDFNAMDKNIRITASQAIARVTKGWALAFCQAEAVSDWRDAFEAAGAKYKRSMIWVKPDGMPQYSGDRPGMGYESIVAAWCGPGGSSWNGGGRHGVFIHNKGEQERSGHQTQKPQRLMRDLVQLFTQPGDTILDPFLGSGSTGVAAVRYGRNFIGIEREPKYFDMARRRISEALKQADMFQEDAKPISKPVQEKLGLFSEK